MAQRVETSRLVLIPLTIDDVQAVYRVRSDPRAGEWCLSGPSDTREKAAQHLTYVVPNAENHQRFSWAVYSKDNAQDCIGLVNIVDPEEIFEFTGYKLMYILHSEAWGKGYATELVSAAIDAISSSLRPATIVAEIDLDNPPSSRVVEKLGFVNQGKHSYSEDPVWLRGQWRENAVDIWTLNIE